MLDDGLFFFLFVINHFSSCFVWVIFFVICARAFVRIFLNVAQLVDGDFFVVNVMD